VIHFAIKENDGRGRASNWNCANKVMKATNGYGASIVITFVLVVVTS
jgi:hypothetical protein